MRLKLILNDREHELEISPRENLLELLRRLNLRGAHFGCGTGDCGACTVLLDGRPVNACLVLAARLEGRQVTTIEGIGSLKEPHPLQRHYVEAGAVQCGYCTPASILSSKALLDRTPEPDEEEIRTALDGVLCRCTGYVKKLDAIQGAIRERKEATHE